MTTYLGLRGAGDHLGQQSQGVRWPYGPVAIIAPFNFPLEIPVLQLMGALYMGNKPLLHVDQVRVVYYHLFYTFTPVQSSILK